MRAIILSVMMGMWVASSHAVIVTNDPAEVPHAQLSQPSAAGKPGLVINPKQAAQKAEPSREQILTKRATQGIATSRDAALAQLELASLLLDGAQGVAQNVNAAYQWFVLAANQRDAQLASLAALGAGCALLLHGDIAAPSPSQLREARSWLDKARKAGIARADYVEALALWRRAQGKRMSALDDLLNAAARSNDAMATNMQAALLEREGQTEAAHTLYALAVTRGSAAAQANMERLRIQNLFKQYVADRSRFSIAASNVSYVSNGSSTEPDEADSGKIKLSKELAYEFARRYHAGRDVQANYLQAVQLYELSAAQRYEPARKMLALIMSRRDKNGALDIAWMKTLANVNLQQGSTQMSSPLNTQLSPQVLPADYGYPVVDNKPCQRLYSLAR